MAMRKLLLLAPMVAMALPGAALAQTTSNTSTKNVGVIGTAPAMCFAGTVTGNGNYDLGVLIDTSTGQLRTDLSAPPKVLVGSFCTGRSTITVAATPLAAQNSTVAPPSGFSRQVNYTATATGWTTTPASYTTGAAAQPAATQTRASAFTGDITVAISDFSTSGGQSLRLVADDNYLGLVTVTIAAVN
jgi:hypothetical protein